MKQRGNSRGILVEAVPALLVLRLGPVLDRDSVSASNFNGLRATGWSSPTTTLEQARTNAEVILKRDDGRFLTGALRAVDWFRNVYPDFQHQPWFSDELAGIQFTGQQRKRGRGRPPGRSDEVLSRGLRIVECVKHLRAVKDPPSMEKIFQELSEGNIGLSAERVKQLNYRTPRDDRMWPTYFTREDLRYFVRLSTLVG